MLTHLFTNMKQWLEGWPNSALTLTLIMGAIIVLIIAVTAPTPVKALTALYIFFP